MKISMQYKCIFLSTLMIVTGLISGCSQTGFNNEKVVYQDNFTNPDSGWFVYKADADKGGKYDNGAYSVWANSPSTVIVLNPNTRQAPGNFALEVDVKKTSAEKGALLGIVYRLDNSGHYYRFAISDNQTYSLGSGTTGIEEQIKPDEHSDSIKPANEINHLKLVCKGQIHELYINGASLATVTDNASLNGEIGMVFSNWATTANYSFTNFKLSKID